VPRFWMDTNVLIEAHHRWYPIGRAVTFWNRLAEQVEAGNILCPKRVYKELAEQENHQDEIAQWVRVRKDRGLCVPSNRDVEKKVGEIGEWIYSNHQFDHSECWKFCKGGDPWVIAHALVARDMVVTQESNLHPQATKPLIPDVCHRFGVEYVNVMRMFETLDVTF
jgi:Domain of unknown function (DUF4411)